MRRSGYWHVVEPLLGAPTDTILKKLTTSWYQPFVVYVGHRRNAGMIAAEFETTGVSEIALAPTMDNDPARLGEAVSALSNGSDSQLHDEHSGSITQALHSSPAARYGGPALGLIALES